MGDLTLLLVIFIGISVLLFLMGFKGWWIVLIAGVIIFFILRWAVDGEIHERNDDVFKNIRSTFSDVPAVRNILENVSG